MPRHRVNNVQRSRARHLRREMTDAERKLWSALRANRLSGLAFKRQVPVGQYIADFSCAAHRLIVEVDGGQHPESTKDLQRDAWLQDNGYRVLRFWNNEVLQNLDGVLQRILSEAGFQQN